MSNMRSNRTSVKQAAATIATERKREQENARKIDMPMPDRHSDNANKITTSMSSPLSNREAKASAYFDSTPPLRIGGRSYKVESVVSLFGRRGDEYRFYVIRIPAEHVKSTASISHYNERNNYSTTSYIDTTDIDKGIKAQGCNLSHVYGEYVDVKNGGKIQIFDGQRRYTSVLRNNVDLRVAVHDGAIDEEEQRFFSSELNHHKQKTFLQMAKNLYRAKQKLADERDRRRGESIYQELFDSFASEYPNLLKSEMVLKDALAAGQHLDDYVIDVFGSEEAFTHKVYRDYRDAVNKSPQTPSEERSGMIYFSNKGLHKKIFLDAKQIIEEKHGNKLEKQYEGKARVNLALRIIRELLGVDKPKPNRIERKKIANGIILEAPEDVDGKFKIEFNHADITPDTIVSLLKRELDI